MNPDSNKKERVSKREMIMGFIIFDMIIFVTILLSTRLDPATNLVNQISLASSFASILLALVAIVYAFFQTSNAGKQTEQVQSTLVNINEKINELGQIRDEFASIKANVDSFRNDSKTDFNELIAVATQFKTEVSAIPETIYTALKEKEINVPNEIKEQVKEKLDENVSKYIEIVTSYTNEDTNFDLFIKQYGDSVSKNVQAIVSLYPVGHRFISSDVTNQIIPLISTPLRSTKIFRKNVSLVARVELNNMIKENLLSHHLEEGKEYYKIISK